MNVTDARLPLNTGASIPQVGLGVFRASNKETRSAVLAAFRAGYRHVDTARIYNNEGEVGAAIAESGLKRSELFITTKLWNNDQGFDSALRAFDASLDRLKVDYVDLYLIHWPVPKRRVDSWRALEQLFNEKRARAIGVSNYQVNHLDELFAHAKVPPAVNQIEVHPFLQQREVRDACAKRGVVVEAYSPLTTGARLSHPVVVEVAKEAKRTPAQVLLRWGIQHGMVVLPKSTHEGRITENGALFDFTLDASAMKRLDALEEGLVTGWDPRGQP